MHIPKIIHYCWFGENPLPNSVKKCIKSWKKYCPDYTIIEWNKSNFDLDCNDYCRTMAKEKKWAFLTDYIRLKVVYEHGGIYLDTDVELIKSIDDLRRQGPYLGIENTGQAATGLGFAAEAGNPLIKENMEYYEELVSYTELKACPQITTDILKKHGFSDKKIAEIQIVDGVRIYPEEYLCPKSERTGLTIITENTHSIHHFDASWYEKSWKEGQKKRWREEKIRYIIHTPNRLLKKLLGAERYESLKQFLKRGN